MKRITMALALLCLSVPALAQPRKIVVELPTCNANYDGATFQVTDGQNLGDCVTGGGSSKANCTCVSGTGWLSAAKAIRLQDASGAVTDAQVPNTITVDLATAATGLAANPADCGANQFATTIAASGALTCAPVVTTLTSTTLQSDAVIATYTAITGLAFTPAASTNYLIDCLIVYTSTAATTGINFAWDVPTAAVIHMTGHTTTVATGASEGFSQNSDNVGTATSAAVITTENTAYLSAQLRNGANATSTTLGFTPETANSVSVLVGSTCQVRVYP